MESHAEVYGASRNAVTAPDLTPAEARAEIEAFMGDGWSASVGCAGPFLFEVEAQRDDVKVRGIATNTLRAAVDALKATWRDAVRPWVREAVNTTLPSAEMSDEWMISRVLKESDHE